MTLETFFEKFDQFADAPDAVAKMRELILQLAVQGTVVDSVNDDEPVDDFLRRIWTDKSGSRTELLDVEKAQPFELPAHWRWVVLAEVAEFSIGKTPPRGDSSYWYPEDHSWVSIADMKNYGTITETKEKVSASAAQDVFRQRFAEPGSILMSFKLTIGKVARAGIRCFHNEAIISLQPPEPELADYLFRFLPIFAKLQTSNNAIKGSTLNKGLLTLLPIALPPLAEQKRIVAKVDELMALCDRLEAQQQERETRHAALARASLARFAGSPQPSTLTLLFHPSYSIPPADLRKSILTLAVQGKLVPQDPNDDPAEELLSRILTDNPRLRDSFKEPTEQAITAEDLAIIPESWVPVALGRVMKVTSSKRIFESEYADTGVPFFRSKEIGDLSRGDAIKTTLYISEDRYAELKQFPDCPKPGDLLLTSVGTIGNTWIVDDREFYFKDGNITQIIRTDGIEMRYVQLYIASPMFTDAVERIVAGTAYNALTIIKIKALTFPLPPLAEQRRIVAKVEQLMALVDALETQLAASRATAANLLAALVAELTGCPSNGRVSTSSASGTGRRGRPRKTP